MAKRSRGEASRAKRDLIRAMENHELSLAEAVRRMRGISGLNQKVYAERIIGISPRILAQIERGEGNPTLETLNRIGRPFGYAVGFVPKRTHSAE